MEKKKIAFFDAKEYDKTFFDKAVAEHGYPVDITYYDGHLTKDNAIIAKDFDTVCIFVNDYVTKEVADILYDNGIDFIALRSAGYNNIDLESVFKRIHIAHVPAYSPHAVAEHSLALMLSLNRKTHRAYYRTRDSNFNINGLLGFDMYKKTAGIIGTGQIGRLTCEVLKGLGMNVMAYDPFPKNDWASQNDVTYTELDTLYAESDIISLHCPLTEESKHMINRESISKMKDSVMIINTGRGKLLNTADLIDGLKEGKVGSAGLDVYEEETEYFFEDYSSEVIKDDTLSRLLTFPNVLVTSHQGFFTKEALTSIAETTLNNTMTWYNENRIPNEICYKCDAAPCVKEETGKCWD